MTAAAVIYGAPRGAAGRRLRHPRQPAGLETHGSRHYGSLRLRPRFPRQRRRNRHPAESTAALRLTGAGVDAAHIHQDIITGTVFQRPGLNGLLDVIRAGDVLVATALDRLGRDTLGLLDLINRLATMGVELKVLDMPVDAQDVAGGGQLVTAGVAAIERENISLRIKQGLERARAEGWQQLGL